MQSFEEFLIMLRTHPDPTPSEIARIVRNPELWRKEVLREKNGSDHMYLVTFTLNERKANREELRRRVIYEMKRSYIIDYMYVYEEGENENFHCHARIKTNQYIKPSKHFSTYIKKIGNVDCKKVRNDNGIAEYFAHGQIFDKNNLEVL